MKLYLISLIQALNLNEGNKRKLIICGWCAPRLHNGSSPNWYL